MASWHRDSVAAWQRTSTPLRRCVYCGIVIQGRITCRDCRDLLKHDPQAKR